MLTLEQVKLLETKVARAVEYVERVSAENVSLRSKLEAYQKRIDDLEVLVVRFKEDQGRIEDGILAALDRLNQFEDALENKLNPEQDKRGGKKTAAEKPDGAGKQSPTEKAASFNPAVPEKAAPEKNETEKPAVEKAPSPGLGAENSSGPKSAERNESFEIFPENDEDGIADPLEDFAEKQGGTGELDIF
jgi:hypothetical protein